MNVLTESGAEHGHHGHVPIDWLQAAPYGATILELLSSLSIAGFLFYRYVVWGLGRRQDPVYFTPCDERRLYAAAFVGMSAAALIRFWASGAFANESGLKLILVVWLMLLSVRGERSSRTLFAAKAAVAAALLALQSMEAAGIPSPDGWQAAVAAALRLLAAGAWFGGLFGVTTTVRQAMGNRLASHYIPLMPVVRRYAAAALIAAATMAGSAVVLAMLRLSEGNELVGTTFGALRWTELLLLLGLLVIGVIHRSVLVPRASADAAEMPAFESRRLRTLFSVVRVEGAIACLLFAMLVATTYAPSPNSDEASPSVYWHVMGEEAHMSYRIAFDGRGAATYRLDVWLRTGSGAPTGVDVAMRRAGERQAPLRIPFVYAEGGPDPYGFPGFDKHTYTYETWGDSGLGAGDWEVRVVIHDAPGRPFEYAKTVTVPQADDDNS
ncbi:CopD family protein [Paenibacillus sp. TRM 82003]|nr:CopD family protein [Paenibacillus sp. TRM 82003]